MISLYILFMILKNMSSIPLNPLKDKELESFFALGYYKQISIRNSGIIIGEKKITNEVACIKCNQIYSIDLINKSCWVEEKDDNKIKYSDNITVYCPFCNYDTLIPLSKLEGTNLEEKNKELNYISNLFNNP
jgi:hypothetical protein